MGLANIHVITEDRASGAQVIGGSLKFVSGNSNYLSRTPGSAGNQKTWTFSVWLKRSNLQQVGIFCPVTGGDGSNESQLRIKTDNAFQVYDSGGAVGYLNRTSTRLFRDSSAWFHLVVAVDTTQATDTNRCKIYVNGSQMTDESGVLPTQNQDLGWNGTSRHDIGRYATGAEDYFDGYMSQMHQIDGTQLDPSYFGFTDPLTNTWRPKKYTGTYGTNGFYLPMDNQNDFEIDKSGNGNNWTKNNFSGTSNNPDVLPDSPSGISYSTVSSAGITTVSQRKPTNWCTLNPLSIVSPATTSNGNLDVSTGAGGGGYTYGTFAIPASGKWYWEVKPTSNVGSASCRIGIGNIALSKLVTYYNNGNKSIDGIDTSYGASYTDNDIIGVAYDSDGGAITFYKNNSTQGNISYSLGSETLFPMIHDGSGSGGITAEANFGQKPFKYAPPEGFKTLCLANLPRPTKAAVRPDKYFDTLIWSGTGGSSGATRSLTGLGFSPDLVWGKVRTSSGVGHIWMDSVRGVGTGKYLQSNTTNAEGTSGPNESLYGYLSSLDSAGFTVTNGTSTFDNWNKSSDTYVAWCWKAGGAAVSNSDGSITSQVSANQDAGFSIVSYTGTEANATVGHGLGVAPKFVIVKKRSGANGWIIGHSSIGWNNYIAFDADAAGANSTIWQDTAPTSTLFSVGTNTTVNGSSATFVAYCFAEVEGYSKFGSYTGNGSTDGVFVFCGFRPRWIMVKTSSNAYGWAIHDTTRQTYNEDERILEPNTSGAEATNSAWGVDILSNGFKWRNDGEVFNFSGYTYIFAAFAEASTNNLFGGQANAR
jgi:hypothetical protein